MRGLGHLRRKKSFLSPKMISVVVLWRKKSLVACYTDVTVQSRKKCKKYPKNSRSDQKRGPKYATGYEDRGALSIDGVEWSVPPLGDGPLGRIFLIWCLEMAYSGALLSRRSRKRLSASVLSIRLFVDLSVAKMQKNAIFSKTQHF